MTEQERPLAPLLVFGLRNPTARYANTRHNAGAMAVQRLAKRHNIEFQQRSNGTVVGRGDLWGRDVRLILPGTYMNVSGDAVGPMVRRFGKRLDSVLIVIDEMDLPLGVVRLRPYGSAGGHNGMKSIINSLGTQDFPASASASADRLDARVLTPSGTSCPASDRMRRNLSMPRLIAPPTAWSFSSETASMKP